MSRLLRQDQSFTVDTTSPSGRSPAEEFEVFEKSHHMLSVCTSRAQHFHSLDLLGLNDDDRGLIPFLLVISILGNHDCKRPANRHAPNLGDEYSVTCCHVCASCGASTNESLFRQGRPRLFLSFHARAGYDKEPYEEPSKRLHELPPMLQPRKARHPIVAGTGQGCDQPTWQFDGARTSAHDGWNARRGATSR